MSERKLRIFSTVIYFGEENGASLSVHPHARKTITQTKSLARNDVLFSVCCLRLLATWLHAADLFDRPSQVQPDSLHSNQRREKSPATSVEYVSCIHRKSPACLCEWNLKENINIMSKAKRSHPMKHFFILIYSL